MTRASLLVYVVVRVASFPHAIPSAATWCTVGCIVTSACRRVASTRYRVVPTRYRIVPTRYRIVPTLAAHVHVALASAHSQQRMAPRGGELRAHGCECWCAREGVCERRREGVCEEGCVRAKRVCGFKQGIGCERGRVRVRVRARATAGVRR
ncbi:hypothetical protein PLICRDRAFT_44637 [Plicaturopsis crispa FD-325 SS-3]|nr:hypothetical protein PLICRDRAFT_44637 [Plicaturopsis crispa FD-325 SS-3]